MTAHSLQTPNQSSGTLSMFEYRFYIRCISSYDTLYNQFRSILKSKKKLHHFSRFIG